MTPTREHPGRAAAALALTLALGAGRAHAAPPAFTLFGWVSPPPAYTTDAHVAEMAAAGLTLMLPAQDDSGRVEDNRVRLDLAAAHGLKCIVWDNRFERVASLGDTTAAGGALLDSIVADYRDHPAMFGYYLGDEPTRDLWPLLGRLFAELHARDPVHPAWNNLLGRIVYPDTASFHAELHDYVAAVHPAVLSDDHYDFAVDGDVHEFFENLSGLAAEARGDGLPFWVTVLLVQHTGFRQPTPAMLSWQAAMAVAYGARGVGYFTWWTPQPVSFYTFAPAVIDTDGRQTAWYPFLEWFDPALRAAGETLAPLAWRATLHAGGTPPGAQPFVPDADLAGVQGRAAIGEFADASGRRTVMVVNADSLAPQRVTLAFAPVFDLERLGGAQGSWGPIAVPGDGTVPLDLPAGGFAVLRFRGLSAVSPTGMARLTAIPSPARGRVSLAVSGALEAGQLEVLDAAGRKVWSTRTRAGDVTLAWEGQRDGAGFAAPGGYFARLTTRQGVATTRFVWLGKH
ncbi:MAG TPA: hypothetical protein VFK69_06640 [Candidatus Eisenbacteria bacterium]|nr:hypothetical protein [Candidatus Eisenbacteria bacterium]